LPLLVQQGFYEAIAWTDGLDTDVVVAPEALLFYRAIASSTREPTKADSALANCCSAKIACHALPKLADLIITICPPCKMIARPISPA